MRRSRSSLGTILLGLAAAAVGAARLQSVSLTTVALLLAAALLTELAEPSGSERSREPIGEPGVRLPSAVHVATVVLAGPWIGALVAFLGVLGGARIHARSARTVTGRAASYACATAVAGLGFRLAGGDVGRLRLLGDLVPLAVLGLGYLTVRALLLDVVAGREGFDPKLLPAAGEVGLGSVAAVLALSHPWDLVLLVPVGLAVQEGQARLAGIQRETLRALETFANIVDERDPSTYRHSIRVASYVDELARAFRLPFSDIDRLRWAGRLHDLGKVAVDSTVLRKPARLDGAEWASMRRHPRLSARLLQRFSFVAGQARAVELHHERVDGRGYYGVGADELPLAAHFLIVADSFDAMTTDRPYRRGLTQAEALAEIERNTGTQFHPVVAKAFVALRRGQRVEDVLTRAELDEVRGSAASYRLGFLPGSRGLEQRPELLAAAGTVLALVGAGFHAGWLVAAGVATAASAFALRALARVRSERLTASLRSALHGRTDRAETFDALVDRVSRAWPVEWSAIVDWDEDGLGGSIVRARGRGPAATALTSWLVREAESGSDLIVAPGFDLGVEGIALALPLRRETSAVAGFLVLQGRRVPPPAVELALRDTLDEVGLALVRRPDLGGSDGEHAEPLEARADPRDLVVVRGDER
jgi:putative nucleotidyltransferase with HDIG domain